MGDRWNINRDREEAERYRRETPLPKRILHAALQWGFVALVFFGPVVIVWLAGRK